MLQLAPGEMDVPQLFVSVKLCGLVPVIAIDVMLTGALPTSVNVTVCDALELPTRTAGNVNLVAESFSTVPVPVRLTLCGLPAALSVTVIAPVRVPRTVGWNVTMIAQLAPAASTEPHVVVFAKSPEDTMLVMFSVALPVFLRVTD